MIPLKGQHDAPKTMDSISKTEVPVYFEMVCMYVCMYVCMSLSVSKYLEKYRTNSKKATTIVFIKFLAKYQRFGFLFLYI